MVVIWTEWVRLGSGSGGGAAQLHTLIECHWGWINDKRGNEWGAVGILLFGGN